MIAAAGNKIAQLKLAVELGFDVPETIVTKDVEAVRRLLARCGQIVYKPLTWSMWPNGDVVYTTSVTEEQLSTLSDDIGGTSGLYQAFVDKSHELRMYVTREGSVTIQIATRAVDWRRPSENESYSVGANDASLVGLCQSYLRAFGLESGVFDFVVSASTGTVFFLECNPSGQYLWIDEEVGSPISELMTDSMVHFERRKLNRNGPRSRSSQVSTGTPLPSHFAR